MHLDKTRFFLGVETTAKLTPMRTVTLKENNNNNKSHKILLNNNSGIRVMNNYDACLFASEACLSDVASCGCCLMQKQIWMFETVFNMTLDELQRNLERAHSVLNNIRGETAICRYLVYLFLALHLNIFKYLLKKLGLKFTC